MVGDREGEEMIKVGDRVCTLSDGIGIELTLIGTVVEILDDPPGFAIRWDSDRLVAGVRRLEEVRLESEVEGEQTILV